MTLMYEEKRMKQINSLSLVCSLNIKLTLEINSNKFLDTGVICTEQGIKTQVYSQAKKLLVHWSSKVPLSTKGTQL